MTDPIRQAVLDHMAAEGLTMYGVYRAARRAGARVSRATIYAWLSGKSVIGTTLATEVLTALGLEVVLRPIAQEPQKPRSV